MQDAVWRAWFTSAIDGGGRCKMRRAFHPNEFRMASPLETLAPDAQGPGVADGQDAGRKLALLALLLTAITYAATLRFDFVFDDRPQIVENVFMRSWSSVPGFFTHQVW